ncbi:TadG family pilus assembly protein [Tianweitania sp.]|uniref:TadG family pilus assembly protein n=1 Tax=Tianweitania sp. TaxID=2021634 RepID=UPI00289FB381|nr:TadG family pilus assembly protein [Tianweitania sp.]
MLSRLGDFWRNRNGNFSTLTAITFPVLLLGAGLTLNAGALFLQKRNQQAITDLAAMTAAAHLAKAEEASLMTFSDNGLSGMSLIDAKASSGAADTPTDTVKVEPGRYVLDAAKPLAERFTAGATPPNAVRVTAHRKGETYFPTPVLSDAVIGTTAIALIAPEASFSIGSRLADVDTSASPIINSVLGGLLGTNLKLSFNDYRALLNTEIDAFAFMDALAGELKLTAGTYQQVLDSSVSVGTILKAASKVSGISANAKTALSAITTALPSKPPALALKKLISLDKAAANKVGSQPVHPGAYRSPKLALLDLINAAAALGNGKNQVAVNTGLNIPGLTKVTADIAIGEPPQNSAYLTMGRLGTVVYTAQTRVRLVATVGLLPDISILPLPKAEISVPLLLDVGSARGELTAVSCRSNDASTASVTIAARLAIAQMYIADIRTATQIKDFTRLPTLNDATLINVSATSLLGDLLSLKVTAGNGSGVNAAISNVRETPLTFNALAIQSHTIKTASVENYAQTLTSSLLKNLALNVELKPLKVSVDIRALVKPILSDAVIPLDTLLNTILTALGVKLGSVDVWVNGVNCSQPVLVQ